MTISVQKLIHRLPTLGLKHKHEAQKTQEVSV